MNQIIGLGTILGFIFLLTKKDNRIKSNPTKALSKKSKKAVMNYKQAFLEEQKEYQDCVKKCKKSRRKIPMPKLEFLTLSNPESRAQTLKQLSEEICDPALDSSQRTYDIKNYMAQKFMAAYAKAGKNDEVISHLQDLWKKISV